LAVPTLVASIYGMNVDLPLQESGSAFGVIVFISVGLSVMLTWFFLRKRWV
jgi:magnesium transporter